MICFIRGRKSRETVPVTKLCLRYKNQKHPLNENFGQKKSWHPIYLECAERHVFRLSKISIFEGVFGFVTKERPILTVLKQIILDEIKQSTGIKPEKIYFFMIFLQVSSSRRNFLVESTVKKYLYLLPETSKGHMWLN